MNMIRAEISIQGRVQGVFYRQSTRETALRLGLTGWVKNCPDGSVSATIEGEKDAVNALIDWCHKGPPAAAVTAVDVTYFNFSGDFKEFRIRS